MLECPDPQNPADPERRAVAIRLTEPNSCFMHVTGLSLITTPPVS